MRLHAYEWGDVDAAAVVCLHGITGHGLRFRRLAEERLAERFRVVALDLRGHGWSEFEPPWDLPTHLEDIEETVALLGIESAAWIGHSFGGRLVFELARRAPERVERAVLLDPAVWVPPPIALERAEEALGEQSFATVEEAVAYRVATSGGELTPAEVLDEDVAQHLVASDDGGFRFRYCRSAVVAALGELAKSPPPFEALRLPTLLVRGLSSEVVPDVLVDVFREGVGELLEVVDVDGGHSVLWDAFGDTADAIERFLARGR